MPLVRTELASGTTLEQALEQAEAVERALAGAPPGQRVELRLELRPAVVGGVDWSRVLVEELARAVNAADGLALWVARQTGHPISPWPGETDLAFAFSEGDRWVLAVRWVTASVWFAVVVRFLIQVSVVILAAGVVVWLAQAVIRWSFAKVDELLRTPGAGTALLLLALGALWLAAHRRAGEAGRG